MRRRFRGPAWPSFPLAISTYSLQPTAYGLPKVALQIILMLLNCSA